MARILEHNRVHDCEASGDTVFLMLAHDGNITQPKCWKTLVNSSQELSLCLYVGESFVQNVPDSMQDFLISTNTPDTAYGRILGAIVELFKFSLAKYQNMQQCYLVTGWTVPIAPTGMYLEATKSRVAFEPMDDSRILYYDAWFKITRSHMEEIMEIEEDVNALVDPTSDFFKSTFSKDLPYPDECVMWTLLLRKKGQALLDEIENVDQIVQRISVSQPTEKLHFRAKIIKNTEDAKAYIRQALQNYDNALFFRKIGNGARIYMWIKDLCGWVGGPTISKK